MCLQDTFSCLLQHLQPLARWQQALSRQLQDVLTLNVSQAQARFCLAGASSWKLVLHLILMTSSFLAHQLHPAYKALSYILGFGAAALT
jgi:hypothetical protein